MLNAWQYACQRWSGGNNHITMRDILRLAREIEPDKNANGFRKQPVHFGDLRMLPWENIERSLEMLLAAQDELSPLEFYTELERIHPFSDGNGRLGAILYNLKRDTLFTQPEMPPDVFKGTVS